MNRRICREALDCGDGVCEVTALARLAASMLAEATAIPTQSGNSADSVAAPPKAGAPTYAPTVHGTDTDPKLEIEAGHEPQMPSPLGRECLPFEA